MLYDNDVGVLDRFGECHCELEDLSVAYTAAKNRVLNLTLPEIHMKLPPEQHTEASNIFWHYMNIFLILLAIALIVIYGIGYRKSKKDVVINS